MNKPKFNPNQPYEIAKPKFDANKPYELQSDKDISELESGLRGLAQGATFGFADELTAAVEAALTQKAYEQARAESRQAYKQAEEVNPLSYGAGQLGGAVVTGLVPGLGEMNIAKAAAMGAAQGIGDSSAESVQGVLTDAAKSAALAGTLQYGFNKIAPIAGKALSKSADAVSEAASTARNKVGKIAFGVPEAVTERYAANRDAVNNALNLEDIGNDLLNSTSKSDSLLSQIYKKASDESQAARSFLRSSEGTDKQALLDMIEGQRAKLKFGDTLIGDAQISADAKLEALKNQLNTLPDFLPEEKVKDLIQLLDKNINWKDNAQAFNNEVLQDVRRNIDTNLKMKNVDYAEAMKKTSQTMDDAELVKKVFQNSTDNDSIDKFLTKAKSLYKANPESDAVKAAEAIKRNTGFDLQEQILNSTAKQAFNKEVTNGSRNALTGAVLGSVVPGTGTAVGGAIGYAVDKYGPKIWKKALDGSISAAEFANTLAPHLGKYAEPIKRAIARGPAAVASTHFLLQSKYPDYRERVKAITEEE